MHWIKKRPIAHRGFHRGFKVPENSMKAFERAIKKNYAIEFDVRMTKDKQLVVFHDESLFRLCSSLKEISSEDYTQIKDIKLYGTNQRIPLLKDVLKFVNNRVPMLIELKNYGEVGEFEYLVSKELEKYNGKFGICSFNPEVVNWFKTKKPKLKRGLIFGDVKESKTKLHHIDFLKSFYKVKPDFVSLDYRLIDTLIPRFCNRKKVPIVSWTLNSKKQIGKAKRVLDNIIFENFKA